MTFKYRNALGCCYRKSLYQHTYCTCTNNVKKIILDKTSNIYVARVIYVTLLSVLWCDTRRLEHCKSKFINLMVVSIVSGLILELVRICEWLRHSSMLVSTVKTKASVVFRSRTGVPSILYLMPNRIVVHFVT